MGSTDLLPSDAGHSFESKIFRNLSRLSRKKPKIVLPKISVSVLMLEESSDSGADKPDFVNDCECTSPAHEWRKLVNIILPVSVEALRKELFTKSKFMDDFHEQRKHYDLSCTEWERCDEGELRRTLKYKMPLTGPLAMGFGPKFSWVTQTQTENPCCVPNRLHVVEVVNSNENIPYADVFEVLIHHCLLSTIDDHSMYSVFGQVRYKKSVWGVVKTLLDKNCVAGMDDFFGELQTTLQKELCTPPSKGKRSSRKSKYFLATQCGCGWMEFLRWCQFYEINQKWTRIDSSAITIQPSGDPSCDKPEPQIMSSGTTGESNAPSFFLMWLIFGVLVAVIALNTVLLFKLWALEKELLVDAMPDYESLRSIERSNEEWMQLLRNQESIHETEVTKWMQVLEVSVTLIQNTERTLVELLARIQLQEIIEDHPTDRSREDMEFWNESKL